MTFAAISAVGAVSRALSQVAHGYYQLGAGAPFTASSPFDAADNPSPGHCDCSGFVAWALTYNRGPWNTNAIVEDATGPQRRFSVLPRGMLPCPGDVIVKPGPDEDHNGKRDYPGHVGVIVVVSKAFDRLAPQWWEGLTIAHCMPRGKEPGAVRLSDASLWWHSGYIVRALHVSVVAHVMPASSAIESAL